jgi:Tir chaperone protein (CesT) family
MEIADLLRELGVRINLPNLAIDEKSRTCRLIFDETMLVDIEAPPGSDVVFVHAVVAKLPASSPGEVFAALLRANLFGQETDEASLGFDDMQEELLLFRRIDPAVTTPAAFIAAIERFVATLTYWQRKARDGWAGTKPAVSEAESFTRFSSIRV